MGCNPASLGWGGRGGVDRSLLIHFLPVSFLFEINVSRSAQADYFWSGLTEILKNSYRHFQCF